MASPHLAEQVGRVLDGRYRVVAPIGTGASAAVYLADDTTLRRRVALKVLHAALAGDQGFIKRFQAEAHTAAALSHPNIMRVLDWGENEDGPFLVLEYLGGGSLRAVLDQEKTLTVEQTAQLGIQAARALDYAHRRGLVHRDIKPGNLLFDEEGRLAIADFGLARALAEAAWTEPGGAVLGTARYAAPEQVRGHALDGKADVYSLALVLFEAVCGYVPFTADTTIATLMARLDATLAIPERLGELGPILQAATHPEKDERIDASELVARLEQLAGRLPKPGTITLPGAIAIDITQMDMVDQTMLPAPGDLPQSVSVEARPIPREITPRERRGFRLRRRKSGEAPQLATEPKEKKQKKARLRRLTWRKMVAFVAILALVVGASGGAYAIYNFTGRERPVPELQNMSPDQARQLAKEADVKLKIDGQAFSEEVPLGMTFAQNPAAGAEIYPRQFVHLKVSRGPAPRKVTDLAGQQLQAAQPALEQLGFKVVVEKQFDETAPVDRVLSQSPNTGELDKGGEVKLVISSGPRPRIVPDVAGKSYEEAVSALAQVQLKVSRTETFSDSIPAGQVAGTTPGPGASVARDGTVTINVSKGPDLVTVPSVVGMSPSAATAKLQQSGFVTNVAGPGGNVLFTNPTAGSKIKRGAVIWIYIG